MTEPPVEDTIQILVATDIHLGYAEKDPIRGEDTFNTFKEILEIARREGVDFILLGGNLFHDAQPSFTCLNKFSKLVKKFCLGGKPVGLKFISDAYRHLRQPVVNYQDRDVNVSLPIFTIHGNHDYSAGTNQPSVLDLFSSLQMINYFGRWDRLNEVTVSPVLLSKGKTTLALFGISHIEDKHLRKLFADRKVKIYTSQDQAKRFNLLILHQNRVSRSNETFIPDNSLPSFLDLVIWGHEPDCKLKLEKNVKGVSICQPGSSVATSFSQEESLPKHVVLLKICGKQYKIIPKELKTVRPFKFDVMHLVDSPKVQEDDETWDNRVHKLITNKVDAMIREAKRLGREKRVSDKPLIKLIVKYQRPHKEFNSTVFGQAYSGEVANPDSMISFQFIKDATSTEQKAAAPVLGNQVEESVSEHFTEGERFKFLPLDVIHESVKGYVDNLMKEMKNVYENGMPPVETTREKIQEITARMAPDSCNLVNRVLTDPKRVDKTAKKEESNDPKRVDNRAKNDENNDPKKANKRANNDENDDPKRVNKRAKNDKSDDRDVQDIATTAGCSWWTQAVGRVATKEKSGRAVTSTINAYINAYNNAKRKTTTLRGLGAIRGGRGGGEKGGKQSTITIDDDEDIKPDIQSLRKKAAPKIRKRTFGIWGEI